MLRLHHMERLRGLTLPAQRFPRDAAGEGIPGRRRAARKPYRKEGRLWSGGPTEWSAVPSRGPFGGRARHCARVGCGPARDSRVPASAASMLIGTASGTVPAMPCALVAEQFPGMAMAMADLTDAALGSAAAGGPGAGCGIMACLARPGTDWLLREGRAE